MALTQDDAMFTEMLRTMAESVRIAQWEPEQLAAFLNEAADRIDGGHGRPEWDIRLTQEVTRGPDVHG